MSRRSGRSRAYMPSESNEFPEDEEIGNYGAETEDLDEEQEVTRCLCGQDELRESAISNNVNDILNKEYGIKIDQGLFIQCDKCSVWQHGYCVGLFTNDDVPDKYWCELCKPEFHIVITELSADETPRTLYKLVNDKRKKLLPKDRSRPKRESKPSRKDRRNYEESYDAQLQKALRESAKDTTTESIDLKKSKSNAKDEPETAATATDTIAESEHSADDNDNASHGSSTNNSTTTATGIGAGPKMKRTKSRSKTARAKKQKTTPAANKSKEKEALTLQLSRDELINQPSKPRFVSEKSSIFELRKRTGAILEWLGRSQVELDEEKLAKIILMDYKEDTAIDENKKTIENFNENLKLMEQMTEQILSWEQKFGKYAP